MIAPSLSSLIIFNWAMSILNEDETVITSYLETQSVMPAIQTWSAQTLITSLKTSVWSILWFALASITFFPIDFLFLSVFSLFSSPHSCSLYPINYHASSHRLLKSFYLVALMLFKFNMSWRLRSTFTLVLFFVMHICANNLSVIRDQWKRKEKKKEKPKQLMFD